MEVRGADLSAAGKSTEKNDEAFYGRNRNR